MAKISVHGFLNVDLIGKVRSFAEADKEVKIDELRVEPGGSASNVAVGLSRLGQEVYFLGAVGDDRYAPFLVESLESVRRDYLQVVPNSPSGTVMVIVDQKGLRTMYTYPGANLKYDIKQIPTSFFETVDYLHIASPDLKIAKQLYKVKSDCSRLQISFDPSSLLTKKGLAALHPLLDKTEILFLNESELFDLFPDKTVDHAIKQLHEIGIREIFIKLGPRGAVYSSASPKGEEKFSLPAMRTKVIDSTGSGDAFAAGVLYGFTQGWSQQMVLQSGIEMATRVISQLGARAGLPKRLSLEG
jgi:sugar/nucleoside kinase (ribokinase family)